MVAIDLSEDGPKVIAVVGAREHVLKSQEFSTIAARLKHYREVRSKEKRSYIKAFPRRYLKLLNYIETAKVYVYGVKAIEEINTLLQKLKPALIIVDDKLYNKINYPENQKRREGEAKRKYEEHLKKIADNLANYFRLLLKNDPKKFREELERLKK